MSRPTLCVIDGTALLFRAYHGMRPFASPEGLEVGAVMGTTQLVARLVADLAPPYVSLVWDAEQPTFRHELDPRYKANREAPPEDMEHQFELAYRACEALGLRSFRLPGWEADDLMATLARRARGADLDCVLVTPDKDVAQLVRDGVRLLDPKSRALLGPDEVRERFGVPAERLADLLALAGDPTDNVPGVRGIGMKGAAALVAALGGLDAIYERLEEVESLPVRGAKSLRRKLEEGRDDAFRSLELVRLDERAPLAEEALTLSDLRFAGPREEADALYDRLGFHGPLRTARRIVEEREGR